MHTCRFILVFLSAFFIGCSGVEFSQDAVQSTAGTPAPIPYCSDSPQATVCKVFEDSFERDTISDQADFRWSKVIMDTGYNASHVDAQIQSSSMIGSVTDQDRALLFHGRDGGSTHEIYLVSKPLDIDIKTFDQVKISLDYLAIQLEDRIRLSSGHSLPESVRVDVCNDTDWKCGLSGNNPAERMRSRESWESFWLPIEFGKNNFLGDSANQTWTRGSVMVDLSQFRNRDNFVFKISVAMDEGFVGNDPENEMEDGMAIDNLKVVAYRE